MSARASKIEGPPPETQNNRGVGSAAVAQSGLEAGCNNVGNIFEHGTKANSQALTPDSNRHLDEASLKIVERALFEQIAPIVVALAGAPRVKKVWRASLPRSGSRFTEASAPHSDAFPSPRPLKVRLSPTTASQECSLTEASPLKLEGCSKTRSSSRSRRW